MAAPVSSAMRQTSSAAPLHWTPPPASMTGRWAAESTEAALSIRLWSPLERVWPGRYESGVIRSSSNSAPGKRSRGMSIITGPIFPEVATRNAWRNASGRTSILLIAKAALVIGLKSATWSNSWVESRFWWLRDAEGAKTTTGEWAT